LDREHIKANMAEKSSSPISSKIICFDKTGLFHADPSETETRMKDSFAPVIFTPAQVTELIKLYDKKVKTSKPSTFRADWTRILDALYTIERIREVLDDLLVIIDASPYGEDGLHSHVCPGPSYGKCTCGAHAAVDAARICVGSKDD
jgi:hypothetical protein